MFTLNTCVCLWTWEEFIIIVININQAFSIEANWLAIDAICFLNVAFFKRFEVDSHYPINLSNSDLKAFSFSFESISGETCETWGVPASSCENVGDSS